jgi:transposase
LSQLRALLRRAGLQRGIDAEAERLQQILRADYLHHPTPVEEAFGRQALALLRQLDTACGNAEVLAEAATERFAQHPDAAIITSMPGLAALTGARVLVEIGDDRARFADARGLKAYAGSAPVTRASGKTTAVMHRRVKNQRLASVGYVWAFAAQRNLFNRLLGCLHHCLHTRQTYDEATAFPTTSSTPAARCQRSRNSPGVRG